VSTKTSDAIFTMLRMRPRLDVRIARKLRHYSLMCSISQRDLWYADWPLAIFAKNFKQCDRNNALPATKCDKSQRRLEILSAQSYDPTWPGRYWTSLMSNLPGWSIEDAIVNHKCLHILRCSIRARGDDAWRPAKSHVPIDHFPGEQNRRE
jgi:hypothetical protein